MPSTTRPAARTRPAPAALPVVLVADERELRGLLGEYFARHGFGVMAAGDAAQARELLAQARPDLALLAVNMPGESGLSLALWLRVAHPEVAIVMLTTVGESIDRIVGLELGADDCVAKPFELREQLAPVRAVLRRTQLARAAVASAAASAADLASATPAAPAQPAHRIAFGAGRHLAGIAPSSAWSGPEFRGRWCSPDLGE